MYLETMERVLPQVGGKIFLDKDAQGLLPLLPLNNFAAGLAAGADASPTGQGGTN
jgi:hypothetical protein